MPAKPLAIFLFASAAAVLASCQGEKKNNGPEEPPVIQYKKEKDTTVQEKTPVINISDTITIPKLVLCIKDSASTSERIGVKLSAIYNKKLAAAIKQNKLSVTGPRMAWYKTSSPPFFFEAGIPVNKKPAKMPKKMYIKKIGGDSALVAHYFGPYALTYHAYETLREWMKDNKQQASGPPYEIYVSESLDADGKPIDPYKIQTDIVFPHK